MTRTILGCFFQLMLVCGVFAEEASIDVQDFFRKAEIEDAVLNPSGSLLAFEKHSVITLSAPGLDDFVLDNLSGSYVYDIDWIGENTLLVNYKHKTARSSIQRVYEVSLNNKNKKMEMTRWENFGKSGYIVDPLLNQPEHIIFAQYHWNEDLQLVYTDVFRVNVFDKFSRFLKTKNRLNKRPNTGRIYYWITDPKGRLVAGVSKENDKPAIWVRKHRKSSRFYKVWESNVESSLVPYGANADKTRLWVLSNHGHDNVVLREFDMENYLFTEQVVAKDGVDLNSVVMSMDGTEPLAVNYFEQGLLHYQFLDDAEQSRFGKIKEAYPTSNLVLMDSSRDKNKYLVFASAYDKAGEISICDTSKSSCTRVGNSFPWLESVTLSETKSFKTKVDATTSVESFLTLPQNNDTDSVPLIVMPHGGPIGIRDTSYFSGDVQWLAYNGFAVLQVNYRGSYGYGKAFRTSGMQQWGRIIEDDIENALQKALRENPVLDSQRVCIFGSSYGGYSAIISTIRSPDKYKCAASFAGVTDLPLLFSKTSIKNNEKLSETLKEIIGDPESDLSSLIEFSPVYQFEKINTPLLLLHGSDDKRVDIEHGWRLKSVMDFTDKDFRFRELQNIGHGFTHTEQVKEFYDIVLPFLQEHLRCDDNSSCEPFALE